VPSEFHHSLEVGKDRSSSLLALAS